MNSGIGTLMIAYASGSAYAALNTKAFASDGRSASSQRSSGSSTQTYGSFTIFDPRKNATTARHAPVARGRRPRHWARYAAPKASGRVTIPTKGDKT